jgi:putative restriction endonuclease
MKFWWVNQNQTYAHEVGGGYLWSPKFKQDGSRNYFYDTMTQVEPGDVILSFSDTLIKAVGICTGRHQSAPKPDEFGSAGSYWSQEGWFVPVRFTELSKPIRPSEHMDELLPTLPSKYSPLQATGRGNQGVYLAPIPEVMAAVIERLLQGQIAEVVAGVVELEDVDGDEEQHRVLQDTGIHETERRQLVKARIGQGVYRSRVELNEQGCRLTGIDDRRFLRASHIKPWAKSTNIEKLDGHNGLMLAPHVDQLFDRGFITFGDDGAVVTSSRLPASVAAAYRLLEPQRPAKALHPTQSAYMQYHRDNVFKK